MTLEALITFRTIENNNPNIHSDPLIKNYRDSIPNSCDVLISLSRGPSEFGPPDDDDEEEDFHHEDDPSYTDDDW